MADIFISYAHEDKQRVGPIVDELEKIGWSVFWDRTIPPGQDWLSYIEKKLEGSNCVLVVWSLTSIKSAKDNWVLDEVVEAKKRDILVPLRIDVVDAPFGFRRAQSADLSNWNNNSDDGEFQRLIAAITDIVPPPQKTTPKPASPRAVPVSSPETRSTPVQAEREPAARQKSAPSTTLKIGDKYGGGKVAWLDSTGKHGLIAAEADLPGGDKYSWSDAKKACSELKENGYSDWYLQSKDELNKLYHAKDTLGGFVDYYYWSSSEYTANNAWTQYFGSGSQGTSGKTGKWRVRPVRTF